MNNSMLFTTAALVAFAGFAAAPAQAEIYGGLRAGAAENVTAGGVSLDGGLAYEAFVGLDGGGPLRLEGHAGHIEADALGVVNATAVQLGGTAYLDLRLTERTTAFVGVGADYFFAEANVGFGGADGEGSGWHYTFGAAHGPFELLYRHTEGSIDIGGDVDIEADALMVGYRVKI